MAPVVGYPLRLGLLALGGQHQAANNQNYFEHRLNGDFHFGGFPF
jgi:hypothetical protein